METSGCEPADLCQAFSDVILSTAIRDVDADDYDNPMLCSEYVKEIYKYLRQLEVIFFTTQIAPISVVCSPLSPGLSLQVEQNVRASFLQGHEVTGNMRAILIDWLVQVNLKFRLLQETMYMTVGIIDRFLQVGGESRALLLNHDCVIKVFCLSIPPGPPSPQEAAAARWCHSHVSCLQI